jgi:hypothetical protein
MHTIRLKISDQVYDKVVWLLSKFSKDEIEIVPDNSTFTDNQRYLQSELNEIDEGKAHFVSFGELDEKLEKIIKNHEDRI